MDSIKPMTWSKSYETGIEDIDEQHHILVNTLNEANQKLSQEHSLSVLESITRDLLSYALYHFETEEQMMQDSKYHTNRPEEYERHMQQHRSFSAKVVEIRESIKSGNLISREKLVGFLQDWLINHINNTDKKLGEYLQNIS